MTKLGNNFYNFTNKLALKLSKKMSLFWILSFTWGIIMTLIGLIASLIMLLLHKKPKKYQTTWYFEICNNWGGLELGIMFIKDKRSLGNICSHEYGHTFQNAIYGPFYIFIFICSSIRYWYRALYKKLTHTSCKKLYDSIWFEGSATYIGKEIEKQRKGEQKKMKEQKFKQNLLMTDNVTYDDYVNWCKDNNYKTYVTKNKQLFFKKIINEELVRDNVTKRFIEKRK